jgi:pimeloyl-ACP methyl ester carboxylesterase
VRLPPDRTELHHVSLDGELIVETVGRGMPVVLIHGWALDRRAWTQQVPAFAAHFKTITYDRRGFGQSTCRANLSAELNDLDAILDHLRLDCVALVGMSQGGRIALRYALTRSKRVAALVLQGTPLDGREAPAGDASRIPASRYAELIRRGDRGTLLRELSQHPLMDMHRASPPVQADLLSMLRDYRGEDLMADAIEAESEQGAGFGNPASVTVPSLVITGARELLWLRGTADHLARHIRFAKRRVIRGAPHLVNMTHASDYNRCVIEFLERARVP